MCHVHLRFPSLLFSSPIACCWVGTAAPGGETSGAGAGGRQTEGRFGCLVGLGRQVFFPLGIPRLVGLVV